MVFCFLQEASRFDISVVWRSIVAMSDAFLARVPYLMIGVIIFAAFSVAARPASVVICRLGGRTLHKNLAEVLSRLTRAAINIFGLLIACVVVFPAFKPGDLVAGLGITSVAIGFAFKDILQNFFAGILLLWREPFRVGDQIRSGDYQGAVEEINIRSTIIKTFDGERAVLPNGEVYTRAILVHTAYDKRRVRFTVGIGYLDSIEKARSVIHDVLRRTEGVLDDPGPWVYVTELAGSSVNLTVYFWTGSQQANVLAVSDRVATGIKMALDAAHIDMPYPHTVVLFHDQNGTLDGDVPYREKSTGPAPAQAGRNGDGR